MTNQEVQDQLTANGIELNKQGVSIVAIATKVNEVTDEGIASTAISSFRIPTDNEMMNCGNANAGIDYATMSNKAKVLNLTKQAMVVLLLRIPESSHPHILFEAAKEAYIKSIERARQEAGEDGDSKYGDLVQKVLDTQKITLKDFATGAARGSLMEAGAYGLGDDDK